MEQSKSDTKTVGEDLYPIQVQAAALLAAGHSLDEVCNQLSIGRSTLYRWRQTPDFAAYLHQLLRTHIDESLCQSVQLLSCATARLKALMEDPNTSPELQFRIIVKILSLYSKPAFLKMVQGLPDTADDVIRSEFLKTQKGQEPREMTTDDARLLANHQRRTLQAAETFDRLFPDPLRALDRSKMTQNGTSNSVPSPSQPPMTQTGTSSKLTKAIESVLGAPKENIIAA